MKTNSSSLQQIQKGTDMTAVVHRFPSESVVVLGKMMLDAA